MTPQRLVIFVEGKGDETAVPRLAHRVIEAARADDALFVDFQPFRVKGIGNLIKDDCFNWRRWLGNAGNRNNLGAVLLMLDGDADKVPQSWAAYVKQHGSTEFCACRVAAVLAQEARLARGGEAFSVAVVFAMKEFEAWLLAGIESLRGQILTEGRGKVPSNAIMPEFDVEAKRDAKGALRDVVPEYDQSLDQAVLASKVDLEAVAMRCRSFRRFTSAIGQLAAAVRAGQPTVTPNM